MEKSHFSLGLREAVRAFFARLREKLQQSDAKVGEISSMMDSMYRKFSAEHALALSLPAPFSLERAPKASL